jgi:hypothetical protein
MDITALAPRAAASSSDNAPLCKADTDKSSLCLADTALASQAAVSSSDDAPLCLADLPDDILRLILIVAPQLQGAASTCRRFRALVASVIHTVNLRWSSKQRLSKGLAYLAALPSLKHLSITGDRSDLRAVMPSFSRLSALIRLTKFELAPQPVAIRKVRNRGDPLCRTAHSTERVSKRLCAKFDCAQSLPQARLLSASGKVNEHPTYMYLLKYVYLSVATCRR